MAFAGPSHQGPTGDLVMAALSRSFAHSANAPVLALSRPTRISPVERSRAKMKTTPGCGRGHRGAAQPKRCGVSCKGGSRPGYPPHRASSEQACRAHRQRALARRAWCARGGAAWRGVAWRGDGRGVAWRGGAAAWRGVRRGVVAADQEHSPIGYRRY